MLKFLLDQLRDEGPYLPNRFTIALGNLIREARTEAHMSQSDLAQASYLKQSSISKIESGIRSVSAEEILYLSYALDKPIIYFFSNEFTDGPSKDELSALEKELLLQAKELSRDDMRKLIAQARALAEFNK